MATKTPLTGLFAPPKTRQKPQPETPATQVVAQTSTDNNPNRPNLEDRQKQVIAAAIADTHITLAPPSLHRENPDWEGHLRRNFDWIFNELKKYDCPPLLIAGDVFDKAVTDPKTILTAMRVLGKYSGVIYAVPGNHDLPYHSIDKMEECSYGVLVHTGIIKDLSYEPVIYKTGNKTVGVAGYYWRKPPDDMPFQDKPDITIGVVHQFVWEEQTSNWFPGSESSRADLVAAQFAHPYDFICFGDNHIPFDVRYGKTALINCGGFVRRTVADVIHKTFLTLLYSDGSYECVLIPEEIALVGERIPTKEEIEQTALTPVEVDVVPDFSFLDQTTENCLPEWDLQVLYRQYLSQQTVSAKVSDKLRLITGIAEI